jgi:formyltetrahydrofolate deformylase
MQNHIILITCADAKGLISKITTTLFYNDVNIIEMREFVEPQTCKFFARIELSGEINKTLVFNKLKEELPNDAQIQISIKAKKNIVVLATKEYHCLSDLLLKHHFGELNATISAVIGNHAVLGELTEKFKVPFYHITHQHKTKEAFESEVLALCNTLNPDYLVLAKFMRILSADFVLHYPERIINIHHSFLPAFIGANPYRQAFERGVKMIGATAHFVNNHLDEGPILTQKIVPIDHTYSVDALVEAGHEVERIVLADALKLVFDDRVFVSDHKTVIFK